MRLLPSAVALLALPALTSAGCIWDQPGHACNFACNMQDIQAGCKERGINTPGWGLGSQCKWCAELRTSYECQQGYMEDLWQAEKGHAILRRCEWVNGKCDLAAHKYHCGEVDTSTPVTREQMRCYVDRYPDLLRGFCHGQIHLCDWDRVGQHWLQVGVKEGQTIACAQGAQGARPTQVDGKDDVVRSPPPPAPIACSEFAALENLREHNDWCDFYNGNPDSCLNSYVRRDSEHDLPDGEDGGLVRCMYDARRHQCKQPPEHGGETWCSREIMAVLEKELQVEAAEKELRDQLEAVRHANAGATGGGDGMPANGHPLKTEMVAAIVVLSLGAALGACVALCCARRSMRSSNRAVQFTDEGESVEMDSPGQGTVSSQIEAAMRQWELRQTVAQQMEAAMRQWQPPMANGASTEEAAGQPEESGRRGRCVIL